MIRLLRSVESLELLLARSQNENPTYQGVGSTAGSVFPPGFRHDRYERVLGPARSFERAAEGLHHWRPLLGAGLKIFPTGTVAVGETVLICFGVGPIQFVLPCRVVYVIDEPDRFGFGYGTLPGHPESGEESFIVERRDDSTVFQITAFSRPAQLVTRFGGPVARKVQVLVTHRYLEAMARYTNAVEA